MQDGINYGVATSQSLTTVIDDETVSFQESSLKGGSGTSPP